MPIEVRNIKHIYSKGMPEESVALSDVSFHVDDGCFLGIIGHTGSGKSTLLQHLNGLLKPDDGQIIVDGVDITAPKTKMVDIRKKVGLVFQYPEYQLFEEDVKTDVAFGPKNLGLSEEEIDLRVRESIELVGLNYDEIKDVSPFDLSGGQKRRVAIAGVIAMRPKVLILDEPTAGLDPKAHRELLDTIAEIHETISSIVVLVSHDMNDVARLTDKVLVMENGRLAMEGRPEEIFAEGDALEEMGLGLPDVAGLMYELKKCGIEVHEGIFSPEEAAEDIAKALKNNF